MVLFQAALVRLGKGHGELLLLDGQVVPQTEGGELEAAEQPHQRIGRDALLGLGVCCLVVGKESLERIRVRGVGEKVRAHFLRLALTGSPHVNVPGQVALHDRKGRVAEQGWGELYAHVRTEDLDESLGSLEEGSSVDALVGDGDVGERLRSASVPRGDAP